MKREILFRGKCKTTGIWVFGLPLTETTLSNTITHIAQYADENRKFGRTNILIDEKTIGQFTGLLDKNGNKIFEGDVLNPISRNLSYTVVFESGEFGLVSELGYWGSLKRYFEMSEKHSWSNSVIGNIHEQTK